MGKLAIKLRPTINFLTDDIFMSSMALLFKVVSPCHPFALLFLSITTVAVMSGLARPLNNAISIVHSSSNTYL